MTKYKSLYFLHIPKTGGRFLKNYIFQKGLLTKDTNFYTFNHLGWNEKINDSTYVFTIIRDPVEVLCSYFMFFYSDFYLDRNEEEIKKIFLNLIKHKIINNIQSKYISTCYPKNSRHHVKESQKIEYIDLDKLNKNLNRINYVIDNNFLRNNPDDVAKNIFDAMGYTASSIKVKDAYRSEKSFNLYKSLTDSEKEKILDLNYLDYQIYDQKNNISFEIK